MESAAQSKFWIHTDDSLRFSNRLCVSKVSKLRNEILEETHSSAYTMHLGGTKMYRDIKENFWWSVMKKDIV